MWWTSAAMAGMLVGPPDLPAPTTAHTRVVTLRDGSRTEAIFAGDVAGAGSGVGWLLAVPAGVVTATPAAPDAVLRADAWSAPAVRSPRCADLARAAPVGCGETVPAPPEIPVDHPIDSIPGFAPGEWTVEVLDETLGEVSAWLDAHGWVPPPGGAEEIARLAGVQQVFVAAAWTGAAPPDGAWLPPIAVGWDEAAWDVPLRLTHFSTSDLHDAVVVTLTGSDEATPNVPNYDRATLDADCMPPVADTDAWYDDTLDQLLPVTRTLPGVLVEHAGPVDGCASCAGAPPDPAALGWTRVETPWIARLHLRYTAVGLDQDPTLVVPGLPTEVAPDYWTYREDLEWAFPVCGEGYREDPGSCEPIHLATRTEAGCATPPAAGMAAIALAALAVRRRRRAVALALVLASRAHAADAVPSLALAAELPVWSTPRLADETTGTRGAPSGLYPWIGLGGRVAVWRGGRTSLAASGGLRGFGGRASNDPSEQYVLWTFVEPHAGLSAVHGRLGTGYASPFVGFGAHAALGILDASVYRPQLSLGPLVHARAGAWIGNGDRSRTEVALLVSAVPLPGAQIVRFRPETLLPGWRFNEGTANVQLVVGGVWATPPRTRGSPPADRSRAPTP